MYVLAVNFEEISRKLVKFVTRYQEEVVLDKFLMSLANSGDDRLISFHVFQGVFLSLWHNAMSAFST